MPQPVRIATFNLEDLGASPARGPGLQERIVALRPSLLAVAADILCLQEINAEPAGPHDRRMTALDALLEETPYAGFHRMDSHGPGLGHPADKHNLVLLSRWPLSGQRQIHHEFLPPLRYTPVTALTQNRVAAELRFDRPFLYAAATLPNGRRLHVVNVHFKAPLAAAIAGQKQSAFVWRSIAGWAEGYYIAALKRAGQALELRMFLDGLFAAEADAMVAVCGDFNAEAHEVPVRLVQGQADDTGNPELGAAALKALDLNLPEAQRYSVLHAGRRVMLDHVLVSPALAACWSATAVLNADLQDEAVSFAAGNLPAGSFHAPLVAAFTMPA